MLLTVGTRGLVASLATETLAALDPHYPAPLDDNDRARYTQRLDAAAE